MPEQSKRPEDYLSVGEIAKRTGVTISALHFYGRKGLIQSIRNAGNQRRYPRVVLRRVSIIKAAQQVGIPLVDIKQALDTLPHTKTISAKDWKRLSATWRKQLDERIHTLQALRDQLTTCIGCGCLSLKDCPLRNPWDELAEKGAGPHLLLEK